MIEKNAQSIMDRIEKQCIEIIGRRKLMSELEARRRQVEFISHLMRKIKLEHLVTAGKIEGKEADVIEELKCKMMLQPDWEEALLRCL